MAVERSRVRLGELDEGTGRQEPSREMCLQRGLVPGGIVGAACRVEGDPLAQQLDELPLPRGERSTTSVARKA